MYNFNTNFTDDEIEVTQMVSGRAGIQTQIDWFWDLSF
jgi:hypothetical protein